MPQILNVHALPKLVDEQELAEGVVVVIDVLRASTTVAAALDAGATSVIPCATVDQARAEAARLSAETTLLGGERHALPIEGFDLGNSPDEYTPENVAGKSIVFTTTNGVPALAKCGQASRVLLGAFVNASALLEQIAGAEQIHLLCAGTDGQMSNDDILFAGMMVQRIEQRLDRPYKLNAQAITAGETWKHAFALPIALGAEPMPAELLAAKLEQSLGGLALIEARLADDILTAAQIDRYPVVPEWDLKTGQIRRA